MSSPMGEEKMNPHAKADANANEASSMKTEALPDQNTDDLPQKKKRKPRKPPAVAWKKPKGMPKRPLSAYNLFFKVQRGAIMSARANDKSEAALKRSKKETVGIGFANLARTIADKWQSLDDNDKSEFLEQAAKEKTRYKQEMVVWRKKQKDEKERLASMPPATVAVTDMPPSQQGVAMGGMLGRNLYDDSRIHPALWQGGLQNRFQQQANDLLFGMQQQQPFSHQQPPMMQSYLQELADNTLLQRQQQQLQELQARQLLLAGALDPTPRPQNRPGDASYPGTWFELPSSQPQQQSRQSQALQGAMHQQSTPPSSFGNDGELQKLTPGKGFGWQQPQLMQDQHLQQLQNGDDLPGAADANMLKDSSSDMKKLASTGNPPLKPPPPAAEARTMAQGRGGSPQQSLHTLASKLDNDTISFLTGFQFNGNNSTNSSSTDGSTPVVGGANFDDPRTTN